MLKVKLKAWPMRSRRLAGKYEMSLEGRKVGKKRKKQANITSPSQRGGGLWTVAELVVSEFSPFSSAIAVAETGPPGNGAAAERPQRQPRGAALLRPRGGRLWHQLPAAVFGLRHQPLRSARRGHVRLHVHVRLRERRLDPGEAGTPAGGYTGGRQSAGGKRPRRKLSLGCFAFLI